MKIDNKYIEFIGLPGSGKTTLAKKFSKNIGIPLKYNLMASSSFSQEVNSKLKFLLLFHNYFGKSARLYDAWAYDRMKKKKDFQEKIINLNKCLAKLWKEEFPESLHQLPLIRTSLERDLVFTWDAVEKNQSFINDDGIMQRLVSLFGLRGKELSKEIIDSITQDIIKLIPENIVVIYVKVATEEALKRCSIRSGGIPDLIKNKKNISNTFYDAELYLEKIKESLDNKGIRIININGMNGLEDNLENIKNNLL